MTTRIAVLRIPLDALQDLQDAGDGWSALVRGDAKLEVQARGNALLVRFGGDASGLSIHFGEAWRHHEEPRGIAVHVELPSGDDYDALVEGASWEGGNLFAQVAAMFGRKDEPAVDESPAAEGEAGEAKEAGEGESSPFDGIADTLMSAVAKRSSRKVLAARLAADRGEKDLGDVLDAMDAPEAEGDEAITQAVEGRFAFDPEHGEMAKLLERSLESKLEIGDEAEGDESAKPDDAPAKSETDPES